MTTATTAMAAGGEDDRFDDLAAAVRGRATIGSRPVFRTGASDLFAVYLDGFAPERRQHHNCHACRRFVEQYGSLATISDDGVSESLFWNLGDDVPSEYAASVRALATAVRRAPVEGLFLSGDPRWGTGPTRDEKRGVTWHHFDAPAPARYLHPLHTAGQAMAEKREEFAMLLRGLAEFPAAVVEQAVAVCKAEALYSSEKVLGVAEWLLRLHEQRAATKNERHRANLTWLAVAKAPPGFCHVRSSMIGTLLEDLTGGAPFEEVKRRFADKMHPLQYQRPQAPPSEGNLAEAEKIVATLRTAGALARRFATLDDVTAIWRPAALQSAKPAGEGGVFSHLTPRAKDKRADVQIETAQPITWAKFARDVLPDALAIEYFIPLVMGQYIALVTAANPDAPPILQWDSAEQRNPVNWYVYPGGSPPGQWSLAGGEWRTVAAVALLPHLWHAPEKFQHQGEGAILILKGCRDTRESGSALFPETLKSDYHAVRRTIEAHSRDDTITGRAEASACGVDLRKGGQWSATVRVAQRGMQALYRIDRWD